ncbi:hypothetical protein F5B19DRAFT_27657 [Rostrohypoxylon terebratum]|nr:hypothetical protein F5B19DRAFT_27657 [Rostrohypoxylon terebratum]
MLGLIVACFLLLASCFLLLASCFLLFGTKTWTFQAGSESNLASRLDAIAVHAEHSTMPTYLPRPPPSRLSSIRVARFCGANLVRPQRVTRGKAWPA